MGLHVSFVNSKINRLGALFGTAQHNTFILRLAGRNSAPLPLLKRLKKPEWALVDNCQCHIPFLLPSEVRRTSVTFNGFSVMSFGK